MLSSEAEERSLNAWTARLTASSAIFLSAWGMRSSSSVASTSIAESPGSKRLARSSGTSSTRLPPKSTGVPAVSWVSCCDLDMALMCEARLPMSKAIAISLKGRGRRFPGRRSVVSIKEGGGTPARSSGFL